VKIYLGYWGPTDPAFYGIEYAPLPGGFAMRRAEFPREAGVVMVSASLLQGIVASPEAGDFYAILRQRTPRGIVGDSIYLYEWPLR
jgi:hypothetical protein